MRKIKEILRLAALQGLSECQIARGASLGLMEDELAFYDALETVEGHYNSPPKAISIPHPGS